MKFQNCILINFVTDARTDKPKAICPFNVSKVGGIKKNKTTFFKFYQVIYSLSSIS